METALSIIFVTALYVLVTMLMAIIPYITRKTESFGVGIPSSIYESEDIKHMRRSYSLTVSVIGIVIAAAAVWIVWLSDLNWEVFMPVGIVAMVVIHNLVYLIFHFKMKKLKEEQKWNLSQSEVVQVDLKFRQHNNVLSHRWFLIPGLITLGTLIFCLWYYPEMPEQIPMQYNFDGEVTRSVEKSYAAVLWIPALQAFMTVTMWIVNVGIDKARQQIDPTNKEASMKQSRIFRRRWSAYVILSSVLLTLLFLSIGLSMMLQLSAQVIIVSTLVLVVIMVVGSTVLAIKMGQGGSRISIGAGEATEGKRPRDEDRHWKLGVIYFNPGDPTIFIEKRFGVGWTVNFGRPIVYVGLVLLIGLPILISMLVG